MIVAPIAMAAISTRPPPTSQRMGPPRSVELLRALPGLVFVVIGPEYACDRRFGTDSYDIPPTAMATGPLWK
jgi:hypothetical protein